MQPAFLSQTTLAPNQERTNFTLFDNPVLDLLTSLEAEKVTSKMLLVYTRLKRAAWKHQEYHERPGVLLIHGNGEQTAWEILCELAGVASATLNKAIQWMKKQHVIGYWAGKNNAGIRIFFNVARGSLRPKNEQKNLRLVPTSFVSPDTSPNEAPFKDSSAVQDNQDLERRALRDDETPAAPPPNDSQPAPVARTKPTLQLVREPASDIRLALLDAIVRKFEALERTVQNALRQMPDAAWLENAAIPKAVRVALATYHREQSGRARPAASADVGQSQPPVSDDALREYEATIRQEELAEATLRALPPDEYERQIAALVARAASDPRYAKVRWADDDARRSHFEALLKRELLNNQPTNERQP